jgi:hypothetical protein
VNGGDPVANGIVARLDRPNGNTTGFGILEASLLLFRTAGFPVDRSG